MFMVFVSFMHVSECLKAFSRLCPYINIFSQLRAVSQMTLQLNKIGLINMITRTGWYKYTYVCQEASCFPPPQLFVKTRQVTKFENLGIIQDTHFAKCLLIVFIIFFDVLTTHFYNCGKTFVISPTISFASDQSSFQIVRLLKKLCCLKHLLPLLKKT